MSLSIKICGLSTPETLDVALDAGADMVGFVFFSASPRNISLPAAHELRARVKGRAEVVALTVDADDAFLAGLIDVLRPDLLQLHGKESPQRVSAIHQRFAVPLMKVLPVETKADLGVVPLFARVSDKLLFDAKPPKDATRPGGLGKPFDWHLLEDLHVPVPHLLSGGLDPSNVAEALRITRAGGVDVSSGVESAPGVKDPDKIRAFIKAARASQAAGMPVG